MDDSFRDVMGSFPPEWEDRSQEVHRFDNMVLHVIDPDIFARHLDEAFDLYVGDLTLVRCNVRDAKGIVASASPLHSGSVPCHWIPTGDCVVRSMVRPEDVDNLIPERPRQPARLLGIGLNSNLLGSSLLPCWQRGSPSGRTPRLSSAATAATAGLEARSAAARFSARF